MRELAGFETPYMRYGLNDWYPLSNTETTVRSVDMANVHGYNLLPDLQDGLFNAVITGDIAVDYAVLTLEIVPEPATFMLLGFGGLLLKKRFN